jgi:hypothetical protein
MWCWISLKWEILLVTAFYGPVWAIIFISFAIFLRIGLCVFTKGRERRKLHQELEDDRELSVSSSPFLARGITKTTEIAITYKSNPVKKGRPAPLKLIPSSDEMRNVSAPTPPAYSYTIEGGPQALTSPPPPRVSEN